MKNWRILPAISWFILTFYLLTLPGSRLPKIGWFQQIHGDKLAHIGLFSILVALCLLVPAQISRFRLLQYSWRIGAVALAYGIAMEFVQHYLVTGRSFELADIAADGVGSFLPYFFLVISPQGAKKV